MRSLAKTMILVAGLVAAAASAKQNRPPTSGPASSPLPVDEAPESRPMDGNLALGLWKSSFGPVKIEVAQEQEQGQLRGVWVYDRNGEEVVGYFSGLLDGNVLSFSWQEPGDQAPLQGAGYLVFDPDGKSFAGKWWTDARDRSGGWNGWRAADDDQQAAPDAPVDDGVPPEGGDGPAEQGGEPPPDYM